MLSGFTIKNGDHQFGGGIYILNSSPTIKNCNVEYNNAYDGGGMGKGGNGTLYINDKKVGEGRIEHTQAVVFSADETADVGIDLATPVVETIGAERESMFTGHIPRVTVEVR
jgi:arylsulfatase